MSLVWENRQLKGAVSPIYGRVAITAREHWFYFRFNERFKHDFNYLIEKMCEKLSATLSGAAIPFITLLPEMTFLTEQYKPLSECCGTLSAWGN